MDFATFLKETLTPMGLDWRRFQRRSIQRRVMARIQELHIASFRKYASRVSECPEEKARFRALMSVTISRFFRDSDLFRTLRDQVLPECADRHLPDARLLVWSAGCASGEEPYSLATLWRAYFHMVPIELKILATDIDPHCLRRARLAEYGPSSLKEVSRELVQTHFESRGQKFRIRPEIRQMVEFRAHDLITSDIPGRFDLILCRNIAFTYFLPSWRAEISRKLHSALEPDGFLVIGQNESLPAGSENYFQPRGTYIYRRKG
ncbi:MAG: protein-glutamate O-methyltransferase CheR [Deltaproteobacteria bacterium]|nr:protein-glutamate O-methyltransferase CheR [Deltaproteobacteria bacterium]MBW2306547.1 protein-glutamate O-methyltransferase CheR [Deltaproteobacteria bacterium]